MNRCERHLLANLERKSYVRPENMPGELFEKHRALAAAGMVCAGDGFVPGPTTLDWMIASKQRLACVHA